MYTVVRQIVEEENEYIRDIKTLSPYLYIITDQYITVYDVRKICISQKSKRFKFTTKYFSRKSFQIFSKK